MTRDDLSNLLVHFTKGQSEVDAGRNFLSIVRSKTLRGGTGLIEGGHRCVCLSEAPIATLARLFGDPAAHGMHYAPLGVLVRKSTLFAAGGRPVIYQPDPEYRLLHPAQQFRHKGYDPAASIDYSWEREWRLHADEFALDPAAITLVVPNRTWADFMFEQHAAYLRGLAMFDGSDMELYIGKLPWHFICIEDLGIEVRFGASPAEASGA